MGSQSDLRRTHEGALSFCLTGEGGWMRTGAVGSTAEPELSEGEAEADRSRYAAKVGSEPQANVNPTAGANTFNPRERGVFS